MTTSSAIDFFFDFSSGYSFLALPNVNEASKTSPIRWRPFSLGVVYKSLGAGPPPPDTPKGAYVMHDVERTAMQERGKFAWPAPFPFNSIPAARAFYAIERADGSATAIEFANACFAASFEDGRNLSDPETLQSVVASCGSDGGAIMDAIGGDDIKAVVKEVTDEALRAGVFGAPTFVVGGELFWGGDRLAHACGYAQSGAATA